MAKHELKNREHFSASSLVRLNMFAVDIHQLEKASDQLVGQFFSRENLSYKGPISNKSGSRRFDVYGLDGRVLKTFQNVIVHQRSFCFRPKSHDQILSLSAIELPTGININISIM